MESKWTREIFWGAVLSRFQNPKEEWDMVEVVILRGDCRLGKEKVDHFQISGVV